MHLATAATTHRMAVVVGLVLLALARPAAPQLQLFEQKHCGDSTCEPHQYCREIDTICSPCAVVCDVKSHNVEPKICEQHCQDYLHDMRYSLKGEKGPHDEGNEDLYAQIQKLKVLSTASIIISVILACIVLTIGGIWVKKKNLMPFLFKKDKNLKINDKARYVGETPISTIRLPKDTTVNIPPIPDAVRSNNQVTPIDYSGSNHSMSTFKHPAPKKPAAPVTPSGTNKSGPAVVRVPSEDSTYAYDNPALTPSPKSGNKTIVT